MKTFLALTVALIGYADSFSQDDGYYIKTLFNNHGKHSSGGYGAIGTKLTTIRGQFANISEVHGGWYIDHRLLIGMAVAASTNDIRVPLEHSTNPGSPMSYEYGQGGLLTEYVFGSNEAIHVAVHMFAGGGFTVQYQRQNVSREAYWDTFSGYDHDENWFFVAEPGVRLELNVFRWMRFCPGVSYRKTFESKGRGLSDDALSSSSLTMTLKIGKF